MKKLCNKLLNTLFNILLIVISLLIVLGIYYTVQVSLLKKDYVNICGYTFFEVATGSMSNTIEIGDVVIVKITKDVEIDDIIVYREQNNFITHRLIRKEQENLITKGDANNCEDKLINEEQILGQVVKIIPKVGIWKEVLSSPQIIALVVVLFVTIGIGIFIGQNGGNKDEKKNQ